ncbi:MAG: mutY [Gammaproteobacteria bacterium]|jgi:A/G-specific adenine glycosylase|nr:mutY [Gammaproteobacteria bacterium]
MVIAQPSLPFPKSRLAPPQFQELLLNWFNHFGRKDLPWQQNKTPYRVWISEIMLQQTQVSTVINYFNRFIEYFPNVETLAAANEDAILHLWTGLGYYNRARNLHKTAKIIIQHYKGKFPDQLNELEKLPGIGRSTAGAILSIAFNQPAAILDGNVKRVLTRLHGITEWPGSKKINEQLWLLATQYTPAQRSADYTQAIMDLGATLCVRGKPRCPECPFQYFCSAHIQGIEKTLPIAKPRKTLPVRQATLLILRKKPQLVLLEKRPPVGVWASLWSLPQMDGTPSPSAIRKLCKQRFHLNVEQVLFDKSFRHTFSHFHLDIVPALLNVKVDNRIMEDAHQIWYNLQRTQAIGLPAPIKLLLNNLEKICDSLC